MDEDDDECHDCGEDTCVCDFDDEPPCRNLLAHDAYDEVPCPDCGELP